MKPNLNDMHPILRDRMLKWKFLVNEGVGLSFELTCILRTPAEQAALHAQGREPIFRVNVLRKAAGMPLLPESENQYKVTWTLQSKHFAITDGAYKGKSRAFDFALLVPGKRVISWDTKWDADHDGIPEYLRCAQFAEECGLEAGGLWKTPDWCHIQLPADVL